MAFIAIPLGDAVKKTLAEEGSHIIRCEKVQTKESKTTPGQQNTVVMCSFPERPNTKTMFHTIAGPGPEDDADKLNTKYLQCIAFLETFDIEFGPDGFEEGDIPGAEAEVRIKQDEFEGRTTNKIVLDW